MKRSTIRATVISVILILVTVVAIVETDYSGSHSLRFAFLSENQISKITNMSYDYAGFGEVFYKGDVISESLTLYPYYYKTSTLFLDLEIDKWSTSSQALQEYMNYTFLSNLSGNTPHLVTNNSYLGFTYSYVHPPSGYPNSTFVFGVNTNFVLTIQFDFKISNNSLIQLIQSQIQVMEEPFPAICVSNRPLLNSN